MRRGLISWSENEVPAATLEARVARLQAAMKTDKLDAVLAYTCFSQPATVSWLTHFVPYWNDGLIIVLPQGAPVMLAAFSKRVQEWIREVSKLADVRTAPNLGKGAVAFIRERSPAFAERVGRIGIIERDDFPYPALEPLVEAGWGDALVDATPLYVSIRQPADAAEVGLTERVAALAKKALDAIPKDAKKVSQLLPAIESVARGDGAEEVLVRVAPDLSKSAVLVRIEQDAELGPRYAVQLSLAYKGVWTRATRCFPEVPAATTWLRQTAARLRAANAPGGPQGNPPGELVQWTLEACLGNEPLSVTAHGGMKAATSNSFKPRTLPAGALAVLSAQVQTKEGPWHGSLPLVLGTSESRLLD
jgi:hypothetical protein